MEERNCDKAKAEIALQIRFNEKEKKSKKNGPWKVKGIFRILLGEYHISKNWTCQKGEISCNKNGGQDNFKSDRKRIDKSKIQCFIC